MSTDKDISQLNRENADRRYVAHFDILGFKEATRADVDKAWSMLSDYELSLSQHASLILKDRNTGNEIRDRVKARVFSDTALLFTLGNTADDLKAILILCNQFFCNCLSVCIPLRGGISYGDFYFNFDQNLFCGVPFVKAHEIGEAAQWMGIVVDEVVSEHYKQKLPAVNPAKPALITAWEVPQKNTTPIKQWVVNWPRFMKLGYNVTLPLSGEGCYNSFDFQRLFGKFDDLKPEVRAKYINTVNFLNQQLLGS